MGWEAFAQHLDFVVGTGDQVRLWHDIWCGDLLLREVFHVLLIKMPPLILVWFT